MATKKKYPHEIIVIREYDGDSSYLVAFESVDDIPEDHSGEMVAIYHSPGMKKFMAKKSLD